MHSGELHPILFFFSLFYSSQRCFVSVKRLCFSTPFQCADTPTVSCWNWQKKTKKHCQRGGVVAPVNSRSWTWKRWLCVCYSVFTDNTAMLLLITGFTLGDEWRLNGRTHFVCRRTLSVFTLDGGAGVFPRCIQISANGFTVPGFRLFAVSDCVFNTLSHG